VRSVREFAIVAFDLLGLDFERYVRVDQALYRPKRKWTLPE
jgi:hypothetical protein